MVEHIIEDLSVCQKRFNKLKNINISKTSLQNYLYYTQVPGFSGIGCHFSYHMSYRSLPLAPEPICERQRPLYGIKCVLRIFWQTWLHILTEKKIWCFENMFRVTHSTTIRHDWCLIKRVSVTYKCYEMYVHRGKNVQLLVFWDRSRNGRHLINFKMMK
jgi:hypothetical protein